MANSFFEKLKRGMGIEVGEEDKPSSSPPELPPIEEKVKMKTKSSSPFAATRVTKEKVELPAEKKPKVRKPKKIEIKEESKELETEKPQTTKGQKVSLAKAILETEGEKLKKEDVEIEEGKEKPSLVSTLAPATADKKATDPNPPTTLPLRAGPSGKETWLEPVGQLAVDVYQTEVELIIQSAIAGVKPEDLDISLEGDVITIAGERKRPVDETGDYFSQECYWGKFSRQIILPVEVDPNKIEANLKDGILTIKTTKLQKEKKRRIMVRN